MLRQRAALDVLDARRQSSSVSATLERILAAVQRLSPKGADPLRAFCAAVAWAPYHMDSNNLGLARNLNAGEYVILSTGAAARATQSYAAGYTGEVSIELDGQAMSELAGTLILPELDMRANVSDTPSVPFDGTASSFDHATHEAARRMEH